MSYRDYEEAKKLIELNKEFLIYGPYPQTEERITEVERELNIIFPKSYKEFLKDFGRVGYGAKDIMGIDRIGHDTYNNILFSIPEMRADPAYDPAFPNYLVPIYDLGNGEIFCLDTSRMNRDDECPVVVFSFGYIEEDQTMRGDFGKFFYDLIQGVLESKKEKGNRVNWE